MKGHSSSSSSGNRGRQYGLMLLLAFGAAIVGVMVLHKLRERRIFNLLLQQKDRDLFSLHLLLQKERDDNKEAKAKIEEMKAKLYSLRIQKMELDSRILEMQSTISSLKDEQRTMESALEEKQNEIKLLRDKEIGTNKEDPQGVALTETLKQKEAEIEDLKHRLEYPIKVWSVSTDDPSNPPVNLTKMESMTWRDENSRRDVDESLNKSTTYQDGDGSTRGEDRREDRVGFTNMRETTGEHSQKLEISRDEVLRDGSMGGETSDDEVQRKKIKDSPDREGLGIKEEKNNANATEAIVHHGDVLKSKDEYGDTRAMDGKEHGIAQIETENLNSQVGENQQLGINSRGEMKMEMPDNSKVGAGYKASGKYGYNSKPKGKRWRILARNRRHGGSTKAENDEDVSIRSRRFRKDALQSERYKRLRDDELQKLETHRGNHNVGFKLKDESGQGNDKQEAYGNHQQGESSAMKHDDWIRLEGGEEGKDSWKDVGKAVVSADVNSLKPRNSEDVKNESGKGGNTDINQKIEKGQWVVVPHDMRTNKTVDGEANETAGDASKQKSDELRRSEEYASGVQQETKTRDGEKVDRNSEEAEVADKYEEPEDLEVAETQEGETDLRESRANLDEDREESGEETDEF